MGMPASPFFLLFRPRADDSAHDTISRSSTRPTNQHAKIGSDRETKVGNCFSITSASFAVFFAFGVPRSRSVSTNVTSLSAGDFSAGVVVVAASLSLPGLCLWRFNAVHNTHRGYFGLRLIPIFARWENRKLVYLVITTANCVHSPVP